MRKFLCGLLAVSAVIAFPVAASACNAHDMVYGNKWLGISEQCRGPTYIHVAGRQIRVPIKGADADDVLLLLCCAIALPVAVVSLPVGFLAGRRRRIRP